jgi:hypothetical protein
MGNASPAGITAPQHTEVGDTSSKDALMKYSAAWKRHSFGRAVGNANGLTLFTKDGKVSVHFKSLTRDSGPNAAHTTALVLQDAGFGSLTRLILVIRTHSNWEFLNK